MSLNHGFHPLSLEGGGEGRGGEGRGGREMVCRFHTEDVQ